jgi:DNA-binding protein Alba
MAEEKKEKVEKNVILIGKKPAMSYVLACVTQFSDGEKEVRIKARGKAISRAVDVAEIVRNKFVEDAKIKSIEIGTEELKTEGGETINVSAIEILLGK